MSKSLIIIFLLLIGTVYGQGEITGKIIDSETGTAIPYVNIGIKNKTIGTISNTKGNFNLKLNSQVDPKDKVIFSHIGYIEQEHTISILLNNKNTISLSPKTTALNEVVVKFKSPRTKKLGRKGIGLGLMHANFYTIHDKDVDDKLSREMGMRLPVRKNCGISALNFNITQNEFKSIKFRINFYRIKGGYPDELLNIHDIVFEIKDGQLGWLNVDLTQYDIYLEEDLEEVGVTIQWLETEKMNDNSKYFSISTAVATSKNFYFREKTMDKWLRGKSKLSFYLDAKCN